MEETHTQSRPAGSRSELHYQGPEHDKEPEYVPGCYEEEEEDEPAEVKQSCILLKSILLMIFPDREVITCFILHAAIILVYAIFNLNPYTIGIDIKVDAKDDSGNTLWAMCFVFVGNFILYLATMIIRFFLVHCIFQFICCLNPHIFAIFSMLDPHFFYVLWASGQSLIWQVLLTRPKTNPQLYCIETYPWPNLTAKYLTFGEESLVWLSCTIYLHIILSLRSMALSIISFIFELNLLMNSNEALKKYLKMYSSIRKFNIDWLTFVMSDQELMWKLKRVFANPRLRAKLFPVLETNITKVVDFKNKHGLQVLIESHNTNYLQYFTNLEELHTPTEVTDSLGEQSSSSAFSNWLLIYYVIRVPPVLSLLHQEIVLKEDTLITEVAALLFEHMYITVTRLTNKATDNEPPSVNYMAPQNNVAHNNHSSIDGDIGKLRSGSFGFKDMQDQEGQAEQVELDGNYIVPDEADARRRSNDSVKAGIKKSLTSIPRNISRNQRMISLTNLQKFRKTIGDIKDIWQLSAPDNTNFLTPDYQFNLKKGDDTRQLSREQLRYFLSAEDCGPIMSLLDLSGHGRINLSMLQQALKNLFSTRKKFKSNIKGQDSIFKVLSRLLSAASWLVAIVTMAFLAGITPEAVVVSGAALLSAITVALSYLYTNFLTSVIFVAFSNPYNVGDRVRLNDEEPLTVKKIRTYTTEFVTILGKVMVYQNAILATMKITNESRAVRATIDISFKVDSSTSEEMLNRLHSEIMATCNSLPNDYVKDSVWLFYQEFNPGHCYVLSVWVTCIESWANWQRIFKLKGDIMELIVRECKAIGIGYSLPVQPMSFTQQLSIRNVAHTKELPPIAKRTKKMKENY